MAHPDLVQYLRDAAARGLMPDQARQSLMANGWGQADIASAEAELKAGQPAASGVGAGTAGDLAADLKVIKEVLQQHNVRLTKLELGRGGAPAPVVTPGATGWVPDVAPVGAPLRDPMTQAQPAVASAARESVESKVTGKWFAVIGIIALIIGVSFFLKYAFDNNLIGETGRVILGIIGGLVLLVLGSVLHPKPKYTQYSYFLTGGGLALLYLSTFAAFSFYHLISQTTAFVTMLLITAGGVAIALLSSSDIIAGLALLGGFITPLLVSTGQDNQVGLFGYILILDLGFLALSYFRKWYDLYLINFLGTYFWFYAWYWTYYTPVKLGPTFGFLSIFFVIFFLAPFLTSLARRALGTTKDVVVTLLNASVYFGTSYYLLKPGYEASLGFFFVLGAIVYLATAYLIMALHRDDRYSMYALATLGLGLLTLAIPIQLDRTMVTVAWAVEAALLTWVGFRLKSYELRVVGMVIYAIMAARLLFIDSWLTHGSAFVLIFNERFITYLVAVGCLGVTMYLYRRGRAELAPGEMKLPAVYGTAINVFLLTALSLEVSSYYEARTAAAYAQYNGNQRSADVLQQLQQPAFPYDELGSLRNMRNLMLSVLWAVYAGVLFLIGILRHSRAARAFALLLFGLVILKVFLYDVSALSDLYRILSFITLGVILLVVSFLFYRYRDRIKQFLAE